MMNAVGLLLALAWPWTLAAHAKVEPLNKGVEHHTYGLSGWTMVIEKDRFTEERKCRLFKAVGASGRVMTYTRSGVSFPVGANVDTMQAWYRLDDGPPHRARDDDPTLIQSGVPIETADIDNPTRGLVWIPSKSLGDAQEVVIRVGRTGALTRFPVKGFQAARQAAVDNGCSPDGAFRP